MGDFSISFISVMELIHCEGGGRQRWAVSALMGLQKLSHWSLTCFMDAAEQQPNSLPEEMLSFRVTATQPEDGSSQAQTIVMATAMAFVHKSMSSLGWGLYFIHLCVCLR